MLLSRENLLKMFGVVLCSVYVWRAHNGCTYIHMSVHMHVNSVLLNAALKL